VKATPRPFGGRADDMIFYSLLLPVLTSGNVLVAIGAFMIWRKRSGVGEVVSAALRKP
jgi:hypothetical protein